jgi:hypothetical protein
LLDAALGRVFDIAAAGAAEAAEDVAFVAYGFASPSGNRVLVKDGAARVVEPLPVVIVTAFEGVVAAVGWVVPCDAVGALDELDSS